MKPPFLQILRTATVSAALLAPGAAAEWRQALPGWEYQFPRDHYAHPEFKTEWWYITGHLETDEGGRFGYQVTFFRHGLRPPSAAPPPKSRFAVGAIHFAHFALSDLGREKFHFDQKLSRGAFGEAGNGEPDGGRLAWIDDWELRRGEDGAFSFRAGSDGTGLQLDLRPAKAPVINGVGGVSQKSAGAGQATHYYSLTRMAGGGRLTLGGRPQRVTATGWLDREWGSNQLGVGQVGWDWFSLQLDDGRELLLYQLRRADGSADPHSSGTLVREDGTALHLTSAEFKLAPLQTWRSGATAGEYPISWRVSVPKHSLELTVEAVFPAQELAMKPVTYWEGAVKVSGSASGAGYLELTGYAAPLSALQR